MRVLRSRQWKGSENAANKGMLTVEFIKWSRNHESISKKFLTLQVAICSG